jgi:hypothetical protein
VDIWSFLFFEPRVREVVSTEGDIADRLLDSFRQHEVRVPVSIDIDGKMFEKSGPEFPINYLTYNWRFGGSIRYLGQCKYLLSGTLRMPSPLRLTFKFVYAFSALSIALNMIVMLHHWFAASPNANLIAGSLHNFYRGIVALMPIVFVISLISIVGSLASRDQKRKIVAAFRALGA